MTLTGISNRGLLVIALLVAVLWGCIVAEHAIISQARRETELFLRSRPVVPVKYERPSRRPGSPAAIRSYPG
ncbi:MAG TPA: hypothetical protein VEU62_13215 [Bryobacterales bacterium]|nr:hypothetical protein [Bryobacterales bacterium]